MKRTNLKRTAVFATSVMLLIVILMAFTGCNAVGRIDAPERIEAELGVYVVPDYNVVDSNGMILSGFKVTLKSVTDEHGNAVDFTPTAVTIEEKGVYTFVYTASGGRVPDATVLIDFADRTAPTANVNTSTLPDFFITGNSYRIPSYTLSGDYDREKCYVKVFHIADDNTETEVEIKSNRFEVTEQSGAYAIRIHVEDAEGNFKDYEFRKAVDGPEQVKENYILYLDEEFGARQVYCMESSYKGEFVSKDTDGAKVHGDDNGSYKVTFNGETSNGEGYVVFKTPAILDVNEFFEIEMWIYNDSDQDITVGATWWNDTVARKGEWTKVSFSVDNWGGNNVCTWAENSSKIVGTNDISNVGFRFIFDYDHVIVPHGTFYLSPLIGIPNVDSNVTAGEHVTLDKNSYHVGSVVNLSAEEIEGKVVDSFFVDGKAIIGDSFTVTETEHNVTVKYVDELNLDNMSWATSFSYKTANEHWMNANNITPTYIGNGENWVTSVNVTGGYNENTGGQTMNLSFMIGDIESVELQLSKTGGVFKWYFDGKGYNTPIANLSTANFEKLKNASNDNPVNITVLRKGNLLLFLIDGEYAASYTIAESLSSNAFGVGYRKEGADKPDTVVMSEVKAILGEEKTDLFYATLTSAISCESEDVTTDKTAYHLGDTVTLTAKEKDDGRVFGHFTLDGKELIGNTFTATAKTHRVGVVYVQKATITFGEGVSAAEGNLVGLGSNLTLSHGEAPQAGKVFDHYLVDDEVKIYGNVFTVTANSHTITAVWTDADKITWGDADAKYNYDRIMGGESLEWANRGLDGYVFGSSEYWAVSVDVKHTTEWNSFEFIQGSKQSIRIRFHQGNYFGIILMVNGAETCPDGHDEFVNAYPTQNAEMVAKLLAGSTITCVRYGDKITMYADNVPFFTTDYAVDHTGDWFGLGFVADSTAATKPEMTNVKFICGKDKIDSYLENNWQDVTISTDDNVTLDKTSYKQYDTVVLTAKDAQSGQMFLHFVLNDNTILQGNTFVATELTYSVRAVYAVESTVTIGTGIATADGQNKYPVGSTVTLSYNGDIPEGQFFNCFTVDGERIKGNTFEVTESQHTVAVEFASTADDMVWTTTEFVAPEGGDAQKTKLGEGTQWVLSYDVYGFVFGDNFSVANNQYVGAYVGNVQNGSDQLVGFEFATWGKKFDAYGGNWTNATRNLTETELLSLFADATQGSPLTIIYVRNGNVVKTLLKKGTDIYLISETDLTALGVKTNGFGYATRDGFNQPTITNIKYVTGEGKTQAYLKSLTVTVNKDKVTTDKTSYLLGETVMLTEAPAEVGFKFSHFTVDGVKIEGSTFIATKNSYDVEAVYGEISTLTLNDGVTTSDGETEYARNAVITLKYDGPHPEGKIFDYFTVDGERIVGNTFKATKAEYVVSAVFVDSADKLTWVTNAEAETKDVTYSWSGYSFAGKSDAVSDKWAMEATVNEFADFNDKWYALDFLVGNGVSIQIRLHSSGLVQVQKMGTAFGDGASLGDVQNAASIIADCKAATAGNPAKFTVMRNADTYYILFNGQLILKANATFTTDNAFGLGATNCGSWLNNRSADSYKYRTGAEIVAYLTAVQVNGTQVTLDRADGVYAMGDTVMLTADTAEAGFKFSHFTVDGVQIEGNTFVATKSTHQVAVVYEDERQLVVTDKPANGTIVKITNDEYVLPTSKVTDKNGTELTGVDVTVAVTDAAGNSYTVTDGKITLEYKGVIDVTVTYTCAELNKQESFTVTLQRSDSNVIMQASETGAKSILANSSTITFDESKKHGDDVGSVKLTVNAAASNQDYGYLNVFDVSAYTFVDLYVYTELADVRIGCWWYGDITLKQGEWTRVKLLVKNSNLQNGRWVLRFVSEKVNLTDAEFWLSSIVGENTMPAVNSIENATAKDGSAVEFVETFPEGLNDVNFTDNGVLKVTAASNDVGLTTSTNYMTGASQFSEIYFYVYIESTEDLNYVAGGAYWQDVGTIQANTWVKITLDSATIEKLADGANSDLSKFTFRVHSQDWNTGYTNIQGKTFYITSLYGVPKA